MNVTVRNFPEAVFNQDILFKAGNPGNNEIGSVNVQIIVEEVFNIYIVMQPRSIYSTINYADVMVSTIQKKLFDELGINIYLQANIYSYMEFNNSDKDIAKVVTNRVAGGYTIMNGSISFDYNDIPQFLK